MKRIGQALCAALLCAVMPAACMGGEMDEPKAGPAVAAPEKTDGLVPLYDIPSENGEVLMEYYSGARVRVVRAEKEGMVQVQIGDEDAALRGYMRAEDLRYGAQAQRHVPVTVMTLTLEEEHPIFSACDGMAEVIGQTDWLTAYDAMGRSDARYVQLCDTLDARDPDKGFLYLPVGAAKGELMTYDSFMVDPLEGEISAQQAYELAVGFLLGGQGKDTLDRLPERLRTEDGLRSMRKIVRLIHSLKSGETIWDVYLEDPQSYEVNLSVEISPQGEVIGAYKGNG